jgi:hypothetical protein
MSDNGGQMEFGFDQNDGGVSGRSNRFKGEAGRIYRMSFAWWLGLENGKPDLDQVTPKFVGADTHYLPGVGYFINKGPEYTKLAGNGNSPKKRIATPVILWPTDNKGNLDKARLASGDCEVKVWIFSSDKYSSLKQIHAEFPFGQHDITLNCTDTQYQKMTFSPCKENLFRNLLGNPKAKPIVDGIILEAQRIVTNIQNDVGRDMTIQQIQEKMAGGGVAIGVTGASPVGAAVTGQIDDIMDGLLDT